MNDDRREKYAAAIREGASPYLSPGDWAETVAADAAMQVADSEQQDMYRLLQESRAREARLSMELAESRQDSEILSRRQVARDRELVEAQKEIGRLRADLAQMTKERDGIVGMHCQAMAQLGEQLDIVSRVRALLPDDPSNDVAWVILADEIRAALEGEE